MKPALVLLVSAEALGQAVVPAPVVRPPDPRHPDYVTAPLQEWERKFSDFEFGAVTEGSRTLPYRLHRPSIQEAGKSYPLVLFMHGAGERGDDNRLSLSRFTTVPFWETHPCFVLAPQCSMHTTEGWPTWVDTGFGDPRHTMKASPTWQLRMVMELLEKILSEHPVDRTRVYVTGLSMGGFATWEILQRSPDTFAAAMPVCGGADLAFARRLAAIPIWVFHGAKDPTVIPARSRDMVAALQQAGGSPRYTEYPDVNHSAWVPAYGSLANWDWLFAQQKNRSVSLSIGGNGCASPLMCVCVGGGGTAAGFSD